MGSIRAERPWRSVPAGTAAFTALCVAALIALRAAETGSAADARGLPPPPDSDVVTVLSGGDNSGAGYALTLYLQAFDNQPGVSLPFASLDYGRVEAWLSTALAVDPASQYPMLMATHLYGQVLTRPDKQRRMAEYVYARFLEDPDRRWPWLAHMAIMAKHRLGDPRLAIRYADALRDHANGASVPAWVRQMHIFLREDVGEIDSARALLGGLLDSGAVTDPQEFAFLSQRLKAMGSVGNSSPVTK